MYRKWIFATGWILAACAASQPTLPSSDISEAGTAQMTPTHLPAESPPPGAELEFLTDFSKHSVLYGEILSGGPPKDGIPAIDDPKFTSVGDADAWL